MPRLIRGRLVTLLLAVVLLGGCGGQAPGSPEDEASVRGTRSGCSGLSYDDVRGPRPGYGRHELRDYPARRAGCRAFWLPHSAQWFTPQALALDGGTAWVSGYRWDRDVANRPCRLMRIDLRTGRVLVDQARLVGSAGDSLPTFCRHGGGLALDRHGLWVAERERLWLVDPVEVGVHPDRAVLRMWRVHAPPEGSTVEVHEGRLALGAFARRPTASLSWFGIRDLMRPGVTDLVGRSSNPAEIAPESSGRITGFAQGITWRNGLVLTASHSGCGQVVLPNGLRVAMMPGIEDIAFGGGGRVWAVSESTSRAYQDDAGTVVPMLSEHDASEVLALPGDGRCPSAG